MQRDATGGVCSGSVDTGVRCARLTRTSHQHRPCHTAYTNTLRQRVLTDDTQTAPWRPVRAYPTNVTLWLPRAANGPLIDHLRSEGATTTAEGHKGHRLALPFGLSAQGGQRRPWAGKRTDLGALSRNKNRSQLGLPLVLIRLGLGSRGLSARLGSQGLSARLGSWRLSLLW